MAANAQATVTLSLIDRLTGPIKRISSRLSNLGKKLGLERITGAAGKLGGAIKGLGSGLASTTARLSSFVALAGLGSAGAIAGLFNLATGTAELAKEIDRLSQVAGTPSIEFQKWAYAAKSVGIEQDKIADILKDVGDKVGDFMQTGGGPMKDFFENIAKKAGVTKKSFQGLTSAQALQLYVSSLEKANLSQAEMTFYMEAIANDATLLLPLLRNSGREYNRLASEAGKAGALMSQDALNLGKAFTENLNALTRRFDALRTLVAVQLMPVFNEFVVELRELYDANVDIIRANLIEWAGKLRKVLRYLMNPASELRKAISEWTKGFADFIARVKPVVDFVGGPLYAALGLIAAFIFGPMIAALVSLTAAVFQFGAVLLATPLGWILAGLALMGAAVYVLYQRWDEFLAYWSGLWGRVTSAFEQGFIQGIIALLTEFNPVTHIVRGINAMIEYFTGVDLLQYGHAMIMTLTAGITEGAHAIAGVIEQGLIDAWAAYEAWWDSFSARVRAAGAAIVQAIWDGLKERWTAVVDWLKSAINDLIGWLPESIQEKLGFKLNADVEVNTDGVKPPPGAPPTGNDNRPPEPPMETGWKRSGYEPAANIAGVVEAAAKAGASSVVPPAPKVNPVVKADVAAPVVRPSINVAAPAAPVVNPAVNAEASTPVVRPVIAVGADLARTKDVAALGAALNDNTKATGAAVSAIGSNMARSVPTGASEDAASNVGRVPTSGDNSKPDTVTTQTVQTQSLAIAEPIVAHVPQNIDASVHVGAITVSGGSGSPGEVAAAVRAELSALSRRNAAAAKSSLSD